MSNKDVMQHFYDEMNAHNPAVVDELLVEDFIEHDEFPGIEPSRAGVKQFFEMCIAGFPDMKMQLMHLAADGDIVIAHGRMEGTNDGEFMGMEATGRQISVPIADIVRFADGKAVEHWGVTDTGMMMQQLGVVPEPAA